MKAQRPKRKEYLCGFEGLVTPTILKGPFTGSRKANDAHLAKAVLDVLRDDEGWCQYGPDGDEVLFVLRIVDGVPEFDTFSGGYMDNLRKHVAKERVE